MGAAVGLPPLTDTAGDATRGAIIVRARESGNCLLCHAAPGVNARESGTLAPPLTGAGARYTVAQLRARVADSPRINPQTIMPAYFRNGGGARATEGLTRVAPEFAGKTLLSAQEVEDVVAYLVSLQ
jgi:L-cysteine S-thiosulfotransferase